jgi:hypothetical protein
VDGLGTARGVRRALAPTRSLTPDLGIPWQESERRGRSRAVSRTPTNLAYTWWTAAIALRGVAAIAPYVLLVPVAGGLFALAWLGERVGLLSAFGAVVTLIGLALSRDWLPRRRLLTPGA